MYLHWEKWKAKVVSACHPNNSECSMSKHTQGLLALSLFFSQRDSIWVLGMQSCLSASSLAQGDIQADKELKTRNKNKQHISASQQVFIDASGLLSRVLCSHGSRTQGASVSPGQCVLGNLRRPLDDGTSARENFWTISICVALLISGHARRRTRPSRCLPLFLPSHPFWADDIVPKHKYAGKTLVDVQECATFLMPINKCAMNAFVLRKKASP